VSRFGYVAPKSVADTIHLLHDYETRGERTQILAGGTDVIVQMRTFDREPRTLVDVKYIEELNRVSIEDNETYIGAAIPSGILNENQKLKSLYPGLLESADLIGSTQIQGRASIGGNLCNSSPAGDTIPALIANAANCVIAGNHGTRNVPVEDFVTGVGTNCMTRTEFLLGLILPRPRPRAQDAYLRFIPRTEMDIAVAGAGVSLTLDHDRVCTHARVGIGAVAPTPLLVTKAAEALIGTQCDETSLQAAADACRAAASPITDKRGTVVYRRKVVGVLCYRAGVIARDRILNGQN